jgi:hypothetical protein
MNCQLRPGANGATSHRHLWLNTPTSGPYFIRTFSPNYSFIGDEAFGVSEHMLRPYFGKHLDVAKKIFNYRLCRAGRCIECAFGILAKWRHRPLNTSVHFAEDIEKHVVCYIILFVNEMATISTTVYTYVVSKTLRTQTRKS